MNAPEFTDMQIVEAIVGALQERRFDVIEGLVKLLAVQNPVMAGQCLDLMKLGIEISNSGGDLS